MLNDPVMNNPVMNNPVMNNPVMNNPVMDVDPELREFKFLQTLFRKMYTRCFNHKY